MDRDTGFRRTTALTLALIVASIGGTAAVGAAAFASGTTPEFSSSAQSSDDSGTSTTTESPSLSTAEDHSGQATSGGS